jgi:hypothetical protein
MAVIYNTTIDQGADWFINFNYTQSAIITGISANGTTVNFTAANGFTSGQPVTIYNVLPSQFNLSNATLASASASGFTVTNGATGTYISGGIATSPANITSYTAALQIRSLPSSPEYVLNLTTANSGIAITGASGLVTVHATAIQTAAIDDGVYYYDLEITAPNTGVVTRLVQGQVVVSPEVTR